jgi:hypothetical protein
MLAAVLLGSAPPTLPAARPVPARGVDVSFEETLRNIVREELEAALRPLREQLARVSLSAPATSDEDELSLGTRLGSAGTRRSR